MNLNNANASSDSSLDTVSGTDPNVGQPAGSEPWGGEPNASGHEGVKPAGEDMTSNDNNEPAKDAAYWERQYKELQSDYGKRNETFGQLKERFDQYGGFEDGLAVLDFLNGSEDFAEFIKNQGNKLYGVDVDEDPTQAEAIRLVERVADSRSERRIKPLEEKLDQIMQLERRRAVENHLNSMDDMYPNWEEQKESMEKLSHELPASIRENPTLEQMEALYFLSLKRDGKLDQYAKSQLEKEMADKRANASDMPPVSSGVTDEGEIKDMADAWNRAKRKLGITGEVRGL